jgi:LPXTG-motif cell wall-anchored protein
MNAGESRVIETRNENIDVPMLTTGGSGTTIFYIAAAITAGACAAVYVIRKRKHS